MLGHLAPIRVHFGMCKKTTNADSGIWVGAEGEEVEMSDQDEEVGDEEAVGEDVVGEDVVGEDVVGEDVVGEDTVDEPVEDENMEEPV